MVAQIDYIPFATGGGATVMSQSDYISAAPNGVSNGLADPTFANKAWRQSSMFAAALANIISTSLGGINVLDDGNLSALITNLTSAIQAVASGGPSLGFNSPLNLALAAAVGSNQLTVSVLGTNGSAPSGSNPVTIPFRDVTIANGDGPAVQLTSALSFTVGSGSTMGVAANNQPFRLWVVAFNNAGVISLGLINCSVANQVFPLCEDDLQSSQAGITGGSTAGLYYANVSGLSSLPIRILGYLEWASGLATAGVWNALPTKIQLFGPGQKKPGDVVQRVNAPAASSASITPTSTPNLVRFSAGGVVLLNNASATISYERGATVLKTQSLVSGAAGVNESLYASAVVLDNPGSVGANTYSITNTTSGAWVDLEEITG